MTITKRTDRDIAASIPDLIKSGTGFTKAAKILHIGSDRLKRIATDKQLAALHKNGSKNLATASNKADEAGAKRVIENALANGWGVNETLKNSSLSHYQLKRYASEEQFSQIKLNGMRKGERHYNKNREEELKIEGVRIIRDPAIAKAMMQEIIANHPAIGRQYV